MSANGTSATSQDRKTTSAFGTRAVMQSRDLNDRLWTPSRHESHGVREASWISLTGCHPNRVQAIPLRLQEKRRKER
jgi:hypothetical protein